MDSAFPSMFLRDCFPFRSKSGVISLLTDGVDLLILIMKENTQIYQMEVNSPHSEPFEFKFLFAVVYSSSVVFV